MRNFFARASIYSLIATVVIPYLIVTNPSHAVRQQQPLQDETIGNYSQRRGYANPDFLLQGQNNYDIASLAFSRDGKILVSAGQDSPVHVWNVQTRKLVRAINAGKLGVNVATISPDGETVYTYDSVIKAWSIKTGKQIRTFKDNGKNGKQITISADGKVLISHSDDRTIKLWNTQTGKLIRTIQANANYFAISPNGQTIATAVGFNPRTQKNDATISLWNLGTGKLLKTLTTAPGQNRFLVFSPDGKTLLVSNATQTSFWNLDTGKLTATIPKVGFHTFSRDGKRVLEVNSDYGIAVWDVNKKTKLKTILADAELGDPSMSRTYVASAILSPDGKTIFIGDGGILSGFSIRAWQIDF
jgi:WD40 repeat protein